MLLKRANLKFWLNVAATALLMVVPAWPAGRRRLAWKGVVGRDGRSASRRVPKNRMTRSCAEPANVAAAGKPSILCKSPGEDGTTSPGAPIARCSRIAYYR